MFEAFYAASWIEKNVHAIFVGFIFAVIGIFVSVLLFPSNVGAVSLGMISVLLIPTLNVFFRATEKTSLKSPRWFSFLTFEHEYWRIIKATLLLFLGIFFAYLIVSLILPKAFINTIFDYQLGRAGLAGAASSGGFFMQILMNNLVVFIICFIVSIAFGAGSVLFLTWNASVWGVAIAYFVREAVAMSSGTVPFIIYLQNAIPWLPNSFLGALGSLIMFFQIALPFLPHLITEAFAYVSAAIVGGIVSMAVVNEDYRRNHFKRTVRDAFMFMVFGFFLVIIGAFMEVYLFPAL